MQASKLPTNWLTWLLGAVCILLLAERSQVQTNTANMPQLRQHTAVESAPCVCECAFDMKSAPAARTDAGQAAAPHGCPPPPACPAAQVCPVAPVCPSLQPVTPVSQAAEPAAEGLVVSTEAQFCGTWKSMTEPLYENTITKVLHIGSPQYWMVPPVPEFLQWTERSLQAGQTGHETSYSPFQRYVAGLPKGSIVLDIGGHSGATALPMASMGVRVISFEPVPRNQQFYKLGVSIARGAAP